MPSSVGFKSHFASLCALYQTMFQLVSSLVWQERIENLAIITGNLMIPHTILGRLVSDSFFSIVSSLTNLLAVLDPRIGYEGLLVDCEGDPSMQRALERSREDLQEHYRTYYAPKPSSMANPTPTAGLPVVSGSPQKVDFMARYKKWAPSLIDEVEEFFKLPQEHFENCDPILWWAGRRAQFPNLSQLARDILSIPGIHLSNAFLCYDWCLTTDLTTLCRFSCRCRTHFLWWTWYNFPAPCQLEARHNPHLDVSKTASSIGTHSDPWPSWGLTELCVFT